MDIRDPSWKDRYGGHNPHPALERFGMREVEILDKSVFDGFAAKYPRTERLVQELRSRVVDPVVDCVAWESWNLPRLTDFAKTKDDFVRDAELAATARDYRNVLEEPWFNEQTAIRDEAVGCAQEWQTIYPRYKEFVLDWGHMVKRITGDNPAFIDDKKERDDIYFMTLPINKPELLGWTIRMFLRVNLMTTRQSDLNRSIYEELRTGDPALFRKLQLHSYKLDYAPGSAIERVDMPAPLLYESVLDKLPSTQEFSDLSTAVNDFYTRRVAEITG